MVHTSRTLLLVLVAGCLAAASAHAETTEMDPGPEKWLADYERAWETRDADEAAALFTEDARYFETPFAEPLIGPEGVRAYWTEVTADQRDIEFEWEVMSDREGTSVAHWTASFTLASNGATVELDGIFVLQFDGEGRCRELREWWHAR